MVFKPPAWLPEFRVESIPDDIPISEFILDEKYGRAPLDKSRKPFVCGITGRGYTAAEVKLRVDYLARGLARDLGWEPNKGSEWDKVVAIFSLNTIDTLPLYWAIHRLSGVATPANASYSAAELSHQLLSSKAKALVTCRPLLNTALEAARKCGIPETRVYLLETALDNAGTSAKAQAFKTVDAVIEEGSRLDPLEPLKWEKGQGARQCAFLCYSSGTSGLPKGVMISHVNVIAHVLMVAAFESPTRSKDQRDVVLGLLPQSHIYGLVVICHDGMYRGDSIIVLPKFELLTLLESIQRFRINVLILVPPTIIIMTKNKEVLDKYDLSSVREIYSGAAPLGSETASQLQEQHPSWTIRGIYGLTETTAVISHTSPRDVWYGSCGSLLPGYEARLIAPDGSEIQEYDKPGELVVRSPTIVLGYLNNKKATEEAFLDGWLRTGDEAVFRKSPNGTEHVFVVDRIKELIKVKGHQVAPAELEAHLLTHPAVADVAVIPVPDDASGEVPKAFVVKKPPSAGGYANTSDEELVKDIKAYVEKHKARYKSLKGGVEFIDVIPKSPSGKILRRLLRDREREARRKAAAKL
ncbi:4-coumarate-CoA ligase [Thermoascus aurantiacus ATCC 26904]